MANMSIPILGMVDTAVVGHLDSPAYVGAVAIGTLIFSFLFWGFGFLWLMPVSCLCIVAVVLH